MESWSFPRSDLFQFSAVLNRFDTILEIVCREYTLENSIQKQPFDGEKKQMILAILNFSKLLFENCTNRNIYNSYEVKNFGLSV
jgi:E3 ubiquitin-protein ligase HUWE1